MAKRQGFKKAVQERDGYTCQGRWSAECTGNHDLTIHHIRPVSCGGSNDPENGVVLCENCHRLIESKIQEARQVIFKDLEGLLGDIAEQIYRNMI